MPEAAVEEVEEQQKKEMDSERKVGYFSRDGKFHPLVWNVVTVSERTSDLLSIQTSRLL